MLQQHLQEEEGLILKFDLNTLFSQLPGTLVNLKEPETKVQTEDTTETKEVKDNLAGALKTNTRSSLE